MRIVILVELALYGFLLGSPALAWYTPTWRTCLGWTYAWIKLVHAIVVTGRRAWWAITGQWPG